MNIFAKTTGLACAVSMFAACASDVGASGKTILATHDGPRFAHEIAIKDCVFIETQWEKRDGGKRVLWEEARIDLRGATFLDVNVLGRPKGSAPSASAILDSTDRAEKPGASLILRARDGQQGDLEILKTRKLAVASIKRNKASPSPRNGGQTHVFLKTPQSLLLLHGNDVMPLMRTIERATNDRIAKCTPTS